MANVIDEDLYQRTKALLEPGEIELNGAIVHTEYDGQEDVKMMQATIDIGDIVAEHAGFDPKDCYVHSGNDDPQFSSNQHQGLTLEDEEFVWECQQLLREGAFHIVIYYEASADHEAILEDVRDLGFEVTGVEGN
ncbi:DUF5778 family protein [Natrarchaeobaculum sulfurireducens]|uniref:Uncharacterized protein n=1 Tax=Natrarchaeobaculum sulfurireducens TaxID=2044521 RepID=A0A346PU15_9EURY|nr:DUF5778 family protein [Natrarchaeobaculum sulfurireducens]AXR77024.1 hypothetical protein AArc1_0681 [Natrarchaeobaculum sulfurireducens]AXR83010.1 hypothetical protein AArcMg_3022 [Natrarchaeobaculum sulfurireducens]